jgi:hypothetical protein
LESTIDEKDSGHAFDSESELLTYADEGTWLMKMLNREI